MAGAAAKAEEKEASRAEAQMEAAEATWLEEEA